MLRDLNKQAQQRISGNSFNVLFKGPSFLKMAFFLTGIGFQVSAISYRPDNAASHLVPDC
jgi:hypothetical protein